MEGVLNHSETCCFGERIYWFCVDVRQIHVKKLYYTYAVSKLSRFMCKGPKRIESKHVYALSLYYAEQKSYSFMGNNSDETKTTK